MTTTNVTQINNITKVELDKFAIMVEGDHIKVYKKRRCSTSKLIFDNKK